MTNIVWVLVANTSYAQIFQIKGHGKEIKKIHQFDCPDARKKISEIVSDRPGRTFDSFGMARHAVGTRVDVKEHQRKEFAHEINHVLKKEKDNNVFQELVLVAPAHFLGDLKEVLDPQLNSILTQEFTKDLPSYLTEQEVTNHLCKDLDLYNYVRSSAPEK